MANDLTGSGTLLLTLGENGVRAASVAKPSRACILVVDDDAEIRAVIASILARSGYDVVVAPDGAAGWDASNQKTFDLVITDVVMPRLNGVELLRRLRVANPGMPVIVMSAYSPWGETDGAKLLPPGVYLDKPFTLQTLIDAVEDLLPNGPSPACPAGISSNALNGRSDR
jgi:DNA-binding response OmpR family regulator